MLCVALGVELTYLAITGVIAVASRIRIAYARDVPTPEGRHAILSTSRRDLDHLRVCKAIASGNEREAFNRQKRDNRKELHDEREKRGSLYCCFSCKVGRVE
jgi:hypothetical protein